MQIGCSVNSVLDTKWLLGQALPGRPRMTLRSFSISLKESRKLLKGTPSGDTSLKYRSFSPALDNFSKVIGSTLVTSGQSKNGVAQPVAFKP